MLTPIDAGRNGVAPLRKAYTVVYTPFPGLTRDA
jgi:hypothetical protein